MQKKIADIPKPMWIRMVLVPDWNDDLDDIKKRFEFIKSLGPAVKRVDVLKYHTLGEGKYYSLGMEYPIAPGTVCSDEFIDKVSEIADMSVFQLILRIKRTSSLSILQYQKKDFQKLTQL